MSNEVTKPKSFEERMTERVKESIGDMIDDESLQKIVEKSINDAFFGFKPKYDQYQRMVGQEDPFITTVVRDLLKDRVTDATKKYFEDNAEAINAKVDQIVKDGLAKVVYDQFNAQFHGSLMAFGNMVRDNILQGR